MEIQQEARQQAPAVAQQSPPDKPTSYECRQARKNHETVSSIRTGTVEERRNRINSSTVTVNATCGLSTELIQLPSRPVIIENDPLSGHPTLLAAMPGYVVTTLAVSTIRMALDL